MWPYDTPKESVLNYWTIPMCALRMLKSEVCIGITAAQQLDCVEKDKNWLTSGRWGIIHTAGFATSSM